MAVRHPDISGAVAGHFGDIGAAAMTADDDLIRDYEAYSFSHGWSKAQQTYPTDEVSWNFNPTRLLCRMWHRNQHHPPFPQSDPANADNWRRLFDQLDRIERKLDMADMTLDDVLAETTAEQTADASIVALLSGLQTQLTQALSGQTISPAAQAKVNQIFANMQANIGTITAAVQANTPVAPTDTPAVPVPAGQATGTTIAAPPAEPDPVVTPTPIQTGAPVSTAPTGSPS